MTKRRRRHNPDEMDTVLSIAVAAGIALLGYKVYQMVSNNLAIQNQIGLYQATVHQVESPSGKAGLYDSVAQRLDY